MNFNEYLAKVQAMPDAELNTDLNDIMFQKRMLLYPASVEKDALTVENIAIEYNTTKYVQMLSIVVWGDAVIPEDVMTTWESIDFEGAAMLIQAKPRQRAEAAWLTKQEGTDVYS